MIDPLIKSICSSEGDNSMGDASQEQNLPENEASIPPDAIRCISGLIYLVLRPGTGKERPGPDDMVQVVYRSWTETGHLLDSSGDNNALKTLYVNGVPPGLAEALQLMTVGQKMRLWIPPDLSFDMREEEKGTLIFDIELVGFTRMKEYPSLPIELISPRADE